MRGIILAGGTGSRLAPDHCRHEQAAAAGLRQTDDLLPAVDADACGHPRHLGHHHTADATAFGRLLGDGSQFGISITYAVQPAPDGLAQAFVIGREHIGTESRRTSARRQPLLWPQVGHTAETIQRDQRRAIFAYRVSDPTAYGVVEFDEPRPSGVPGGKAEVSAIGVRGSRAVLL